MGEARQKRSATARLIERFPGCAFCGNAREAVTREHMPPKAIFDNSHRPDRLVMPACEKCNAGTSTADLVVSVIARWRFGEGTPDEFADHGRLVERLRKQAPDVTNEWLNGVGHQERARRHLSGFISLPEVGGFTTIGPQTVRQLNLFAHKLTLGLFFQEHSMSLPNKGRVWAFWKTKEDVMYSGVPEEIFRIVPGYGALIQGRWNTSETFEYRTGRDCKVGTFACLARLRGGLIVGGFAIVDANMLDEQASSWTSPSDLLQAAQTHRFTRRNVD